MAVRACVAALVTLCGCAGSAPPVASERPAEVTPAPTPEPVAGAAAPEPVASGGRSPATEQGYHHGHPQCAQVLDASFPADTQFPHVLAFELGHASLRPNDRIVIREMRGTRPAFELGGIYLVRGEYTLASADDASLGFSVTARVPGEGCTKGNLRGYAQVKRGSGTFELAVPVQFAGHLHLSFYVAGTASGDLYVGKGDFLLR